MRERKTRGRSRNAAHESSAVKESGHIEPQRGPIYYRARHIVYRSRAASG